MSLEEYERNIAKKREAIRAATEAAEREQQQAREEKRERMRRLYCVLDSQINTVDIPWISRCENGDRTELEFESHRFEIREVAAHREE